MATIKKIADLAGVSVATVSYVMNNRPDVSADTRLKVLDIAKKINYVPLRVSRARKGAAAKVKSFAFVSCLPFDPWGEPYWGQFLSGCLEESHGRDFVLQVARIDPDAVSRNNIPVTIRERMADGLIVTGWPTQAIIDSLAEQKIPMVLVDTKDVFDGFSHVRPDHAGGIVKAVRYLHQLGHDRIGVITGDMSFTCEAERLAAYYMAMMQLNLAWKQEWIVRQPWFNEQSGVQGMKDIIRRKVDVTAVICHGDQIARGALRVAREEGVRVPGDLGIVGIDNQPWSDTTDPPMTTVDVSLVELGQVTVRHLFERINDPKQSPRRITIEAKMVVRNSTGPVSRKR